MKDFKNHGDVVIKFNKLNSKLEPYDLMIIPWEKSWGNMAITKISKANDDYIAKNIDSIEEAEQWVNGFLHGAKWAFDAAKVNA